MNPLRPLRLFMTGMVILTGPHMIGPDTMITGTEVQSVMRNLPMAEKRHHLDTRDLLMGEKDLHMDVKGHHIGGTDPHMDMIDPPMDARNPHMDLRNHHMTGAAIMSIEKGVLLIRKGPHRTEPGTMIAVIGHQITWIVPHMIGLSPVIIKKQVERGEQLRSGTLSMVINRRIRSAKRILMLGTQNPQLRNLKIKVACLILMAWMKGMKLA